MNCYSFNGKRPHVASDAFVHPTAVLIGAVNIGRKCYIGPCASLRGDFGCIRIGAGANVQDNCVIHTFPNEDVVLEEDAHIGHAAVLHGCTVCCNALVGIQSIVMDGARVGRESMVGAGSFVPARFEIPPRTLVIGNPCRIARPLNDDDIRRKSHGTSLYQELAQQCLASLQPCTPTR